MLVMVMGDPGLREDPSTDTAPLNVDHPCRDLSL